MNIWIFLNGVGGANRNIREWGGGGKPAREQLFLMPRFKIDLKLVKLRRKTSFFENGDFFEINGFVPCFV